MRASARQSQAGGGFKNRSPAASVFRPSDEVGLSAPKRPSGQTTSNEAAAVVGPRPYPDPQGENPPHADGFLLFNNFEGVSIHAARSAFFSPRVNSFPLNWIASKPQRSLGIMPNSMILRCYRLCEVGKVDQGIAPTLMQEPEQPAKSHNFNLITRGQSIQRLRVRTPATSTCYPVAVKKQRVMDGHKTTSSAS